MGDRGNVSYARTGETTEWEDILMKKNIVTREQVFAAKGLDARDFPDPKTVKKDIHVHYDGDSMLNSESTIGGKQVNRRNDDEDDDARYDSDEDEEEDDDDMEASFMEKYRAERMNQMREKAAKERFGEVVEINKAEWVKEVTEASNEQWVLVYMYSDSVTDCRVFDDIYATIAKKFKSIKFAKIISSLAVENWPEKNLPTVYAYKDGNVSSVLMTLKEIGGRGVTPLDFEWYLSTKGVVESELEEDPRANKASVRIDKGRNYNEDGDY